MTGDIPKHWTAPAAVQVTALAVSNPVAVHTSDAAPLTLVAFSQTALCTFPYLIPVLLSL